MTDPKKKAEYLAAAARWLALAQSGSLVERLSRFIASKNPAAQPTLGTKVGNFWPVTFERGQVVISHGQKVTTVFFVTDAVISLVMPTGLEIAMLGADAGVGMLQALHGGHYPYEAVTRISGTGLACDARSFKAAVLASPAVLQKILLAEQQIAGLIAQTAVCNSSHLLSARLARWLSRLHELSGHFEINVTQEELANYLGVVRPVVTTAQDQLRQERLIEYRRGRIEILDPSRLKSRACGCALLSSRGQDVLLDD